MDFVGCVEIFEAVLEIVWMYVDLYEKKHVKLKNYNVLFYKVEVKRE